MGRVITFFVGVVVVAIALLLVILAAKIIFTVLFGALYCLLVIALFACGGWIIAKAIIEGPR